MAIDAHAHYFPASVLDVLDDRGREFGINVLGQAPACARCLQFAYGLRVRPFPQKLVEDPSERIARMDGQGITRQLLSTWTDIFGYGLPAAEGARWHRLLNDSMAEWCASNSDRFSWMASGALPDAASAARELERSVQNGAVAAVVAANVEGTNLGELDLDEFWAAAVALGVPVFIHPAQPDPTPRTGFFALNPIAQYTFDTTLAVGSLIASGVFDRFPGLQVLLSHGGGTFPYLHGRFDCLHTRSDHGQTKITAQHKPSDYLSRLYYDTLVHSPAVLRFLAELVGTDRLVLGTDDSFPPADFDPLGSVRAAGFDAATVAKIAEENPRALFRL